MVVGIMGVGAVGGTLAKWFKENTSHDVRLYDPPKGHLDFMSDCEAIFVSVPVPDSKAGQDQSVLEMVVKEALSYTPNVFIRSTVVPSTNDRLGTISMPEFLTEKTAYQDMSQYPIICGPCDIRLLDRIFPNKQIYIMKNVECEIGKLGHNALGAVKITFCNMLYHIGKFMGADYNKIQQAMLLTGHINKQHTNVAPDGNFGYGGKCFPTNIKALEGFCEALKYTELDVAYEKEFFALIDELNHKYRGRK